MKLVGLIGSGRIAPFYAEVLRDINDCKISVCGSVRSDTARDLANKFNFEYHETAHELIEANDFIIIACKNEYALDYLKKCDQLGKKILVEKPIYEEHDKEYVPINRGNIQIGYNRRYYKSVKKLNDICKNSERKLLFNIIAPERTLKEGDKYFHLKSNGVHLIDLAVYLVGGMNGYEIDKISNKDSLILKIFGSAHNAILNWRFNAVANTSVTVDLASETHVLNPIEKYSLFDKLTIHESIVENRNVRTYLPESSEKKEIDDRTFEYKPGFKMQIEEFLSEESSKIQMTSLKDAYQYVQILKEVVSYLNEQ